MDEVFYFPLLLLLLPPPFASLSVPFPTSFLLWESCKLPHGSRAQPRPKSEFDEPLSCRKATDGSHINKYFEVHVLQSME